MDFLNYIIETDTYKNLLYFVLGGLFVLFSYHFFRYVSNRERPYLYYSLYALFSFLAYITVAESGFFRHFSSYFRFDNLSKDFFTTLYNGMYFLFFASFLDLRQKNRCYFRIATQPVYILIALSCFFFAVAKISGKNAFFEGYKLFFIFCISIQTVVSFIILLKIKNRLKWYIITGGVLLFLTSIVGEEAIRNLIHISYKKGDFIFFIGLFVENMLFSLALGHRQKLEYAEKMQVQSNLIHELKVNEKLKNEISRKNEINLRAENERIRIQQENTELALSALRSQINPHFIFNTLHSIKLYMMMNEREQAVDYLDKFSRLIRLILHASFQKESTLKAEISILQLYLEIENIRFEGKIEYHFITDTQVDTEQIKVPPLFLQPFLENAIWHGIATSEKKEINIAVCQRGLYLDISVCDSGTGISGERKTGARTSYGTRISSEALKNFYGKDFSLSVKSPVFEDEKSPGTCVTVTIPLPRKK